MARMTMRTSDTAARRSRGRRREGASFPVGPSRARLPADYTAAFAEIKERIRKERLRVVLAANAGLVLLYWDIGRAILDRQGREGWGAKVIDRLSHDLCEVFSDMRGLSPRNLRYMRAFAAAWPDRRFVQEVLAQITWYHCVALLDKVKDPETCLWYARKAREEGWSRNVLVMQIEAKLHERTGKAINNYLSAVDDLLRHADDKPTIGLLLCRSKDRLVVEYALRGFDKPMGVAEWETRLVESLPEELKGSLPSVDEIEKELNGSGDANA